MKTRNGSHSPIASDLGICIPRTAVILMTPLYQQKSWLMTSCNNKQHKQYSSCIANTICTASYTGFTCGGSCSPSDPCFVIDISVSRVLDNTEGKYRLPQPQIANHLHMIRAAAFGVMPVDSLVMDRGTLAPAQPMPSIPGYMYKFLTAT